MSALGGAVGDPHATARLPSLDHHDSDVARKHRIHTRPRTARYASCLGSPVGEGVWEEESWLVEDFEVRFGATTRQVAFVASR